MELLSATKWHTDSSTISELFSAGWGPQRARVWLGGVEIGTAA
jgi:hypothetical protein